MTTSEIIITIDLLATLDFVRSKLLSSVAKKDAYGTTLVVWNKHGVRSKIVLVVCVMR